MIELFFAHDTILAKMYVFAPSQAKLALYSNDVQMRWPILVSKVDE